MSYFAAALSRGESGWASNELDLDEVETLDEIAELGREAVLDVGGDDATVIVLIEQDAWFGVVRADIAEDPRVFVSNAGPALRHALGELLLPDLVAARQQQDEGEQESSGAAVAEAAYPTGPAGDSALLSDLGLSPSDLIDLAEQPRTADALAEIAESLGCPDPFESVR